MSTLLRDGGGQRLREVFSSDALRLIDATMERTQRIQLQAVYLLSALLLLSVLVTGAVLVVVMLRQPEVRAVDQSGRVWEIPRLSDGSQRLKAGRWVSSFESLAEQKKTLRKPPPAAAASGTRPPY